MRLRKYQRPQRACAFDPTGHVIVSGGDSNLIHRWNLKTDKHDDLEGHDSWVLSFAFPDPQRLISGGYDGRLIWWKLNGKPAIQAKLEAHQGWIRSIALSPDKRLLATVGNDKLVKIWDVKSHRQVRSLSGHPSHVYSAAFHPGGEFLVSADHKGVIKQWDTRTWRKIRELDASPLYTWHKGYRAAAGGVRSMDFSHDGKWLAGCGLTDATDTFGQVVRPAVVLFDWESGKRTRVQRSNSDEYGVAWGVQFHPSGQFHTAVCGGRTGKHMYFWDTRSDKPLHTIALNSAARDLAIHPDGKSFAIADISRCIRILSS